MGLSEPIVKSVIVTTALLGKRKCDEFSFCIINRNLYLYFTCITLIDTMIWQISFNFKNNSVSETEYLRSFYHQKIYF